MSVDSAEAQATGGSSSVPSTSADGRYVVFHSYATDLVANDTNGVTDVFLRDRHAGTTERVSVSSAEGQGDRESTQASISADGRFVAFDSLASDFVAEDTNGDFDVFVRDRHLGTTRRVSVSSAEGQGNDDSSYPSISATAATSPSTRAPATSSPPTRTDRPAHGISRPRLDEDELRPLGDSGAQVHEMLEWNEPIVPSGDENRRGDPSDAVGIGDRVDLHHLALDDGETAAAAPGQQL